MKNSILAARPPRCSPLGPPLGRIAVVTGQSASTLLKPIVKVFFSTQSDMHIPPVVIDLSAPDCTEKITAREDPAYWRFQDLNTLWSGLGPLS